MRVKCGEECVPMAPWRGCGGGERIAADIRHRSRENVARRRVRRCGGVDEWKHGAANGMIPRKLSHFIRPSKYL